ncbi:MAG: CRISPR-associated endonuclease Cas2 [Cyanobacteria bacterium REEB446]|jgi:CRISPR-associated protein Cas2|nr:CRISPR-associated endonuclease Cas2 [Cyanobacteria bacterium REEB446]
MTLEKNFLVMYDISDPKRLRKVHSICKKFGIPQQLSIFELKLTARKFILFLREIRQWINTKEDQLVYICLCTNCNTKIKAIGEQWDTSLKNSCVIL